MADLLEYQFEIDGYVFGRRCPIFVDKDGFDPGDPSWITQDQESSLTGATLMGRDVRTAPLWTWALHVDQEDSATALEELGRLGAKWANGARGWQVSRDITTIRYCVGGRTRRVFGRPRRFSANPDNRLMSGYLPPVATFQRADSLHYDDHEQLVDMGLKPAETGGVVLPSAFPLTFERDPDFVPAGMAVVGGDAATWPVVTFEGPITNPSVQIGDVKIGMTGQIDEGGAVTIDTRPWSQEVSRTGSTSEASLSRETRLARSALAPGSYSIAFRGLDTSGEARCQVRWRDAWHTL